ncbi:MAG TPA: hypothetical protein VFZ02_10080 [Ktedonobacteraceae bacterium]
MNHGYRNNYDPLAANFHSRNDYWRGVRPSNSRPLRSVGVEGDWWQELAFGYRPHSALSVFLLIRYLMGLREEEAGIVTVAPVFPLALRCKGASFKIAPIQWGKYALSMECLVRDAGCLTAEGQPVQQWEWEGMWGEERKIILPQVPS